MPLMPEVLPTPIPRLMERGMGEWLSDRYADAVLCLALSSVSRSDPRRQERDGSARSGHVWQQATTVALAQRVVWLPSAR